MLTRMKHVVIGNYITGFFNIMIWITFMKYHELLKIRLLVNMSIICRSPPVWLIHR